MKRNLLYPSFELVFATGIVAILTLPQIMLAQDTKEFKVTITNGDTTINGKNIKKMSATERTAALKELGESGITMFSDGPGHKSLSVAQHGGKGKKVIVEKTESFGDGPEIANAPMARAFSFSLDSNKKFGERRQMTLRSADGTSRPMEFSYDMRSDNAAEPRWSINAPAIGLNRKNTQTFNYSNTDNDGISTHVNFRVSDANMETLKRLTTSEKGEISIKDLTLIPSFSTGKTAISFTLPEKGSADIEFKNSEGKTLWTEKTTATSFYKSFELPQNGVYYLQVKQAGKVGLRRIVKEE